MFAKVRHRTVRVKRTLPQDTAKLMVFKLILTIIRIWRWSNRVRFKTHGFRVICRQLPWSLQTGFLRSQVPFLYTTFGDPPGIQPCRDILSETTTRGSRRDDRGGRDVALSPRQGEQAVDLDGPRPGQPSADRLEVWRSRSVDHRGPAGPAPALEHQRLCNLGRLIRIRVRESKQQR